MGMGKDVDKLIGFLTGALSLPAKTAGLGGIYALSAPCVFGMYQLLRDLGPYKTDDAQSFVEDSSVSLALFWVVSSPFLIPPMVSAALPFPLNNSIVLAVGLGAASLWYTHLVGTLVTSRSPAEAIRKTARWTAYLLRLAAWPPIVLAGLGKSFLVKSLRTFVEFIMGILLFIFRSLGLEDVWVKIIKPLFDILKKAAEFMFGTIGPAVDAIKSAIDTVAGALGGGGGGIAGDIAGGVGGAVSSGVSAIGGALGLSDVRLKNQLTRVGEHKPGVFIYEWQWTAEALKLGAEPERTRGVLAQEVQQVDPEAVTVSPEGFLMVARDYFSD